MSDYEQLVAVTDDTANYRHMKKYGLEDQDWRPGMMQMMKKGAQKADK